LERGDVAAKAAKMGYKWKDRTGRKIRFCEIFGLGVVVWLFGIGTSTQLLMKKDVQ
jgi:hypothetical protein